MALAPFFDRVYGAVAGHLPVSRESLTKLLSGIVVGVRCGTHLTPNDIHIAELATNLLARLYPYLAITAPEPHCSALRALAKRINPGVEFATGAPARYTISVNCVAADDALYPTASGWVARLTHTDWQNSGAENPYAAGFAAALATAELFRRIFLEAESEPDISLSLLDFGPNEGADQELPVSDMAEVVFAGLGAVANSGLWAMAKHSSLTGRVFLVDDDVVLLPNLQRYVLATFRDVSKPKVRLSAAALNKSRLGLEISRKKLEAFAEERGGISSPTMCISVDNVPTRKAAQALLPKLLINGWTGDQALGASWHVFSRNAACLACLYHSTRQRLSQTEQAAKAFGLTNQRAAELWVTRMPLSESDLKTAAGALGVSETVLKPWRGKSLGELYTDVTCGAVPIELPSLGRIETVPLAHQSALAGILMSAELVKRTHPELAKFSQTHSLISWDDILKPPPPAGRWVKPRPRERGCFCGDETYQKIYRKKWGEALY